MVTLHASMRGGALGVSLSRALEESSCTLYDQKELLCVYPANVIKYLYVCYGCPEMYIILYYSGESDLNIRKSVKELISVLVDCGACLSRPHNIFGRVRNVEVEPPLVNGTPALLGYQEIGPRWCAGKTQ